jgi:hypothetical protein
MGCVGNGVERAGYNFHCCIIKPPAFGLAVPLWDEDLGRPSGFKFLGRGCRGCSAPVRVQTLPMRRISTRNQDSPVAQTDDDDIAAGRADRGEIAYDGIVNKDGWIT